MEKVYLKFRLEVLPGDYLLFQVLEMDERFRCKSFLMSDFVIDTDYPKDLILSVGNLTSKGFDKADNSPKIINSLNGKTGIFDCAGSWELIIAEPEESKKNPKPFQERRSFKTVKNIGNYKKGGF